MTPNSSRIEEEAAEWAAKSERGKVAMADQDRFDAWLKADERHRGAFMKALAVQIHMGKLGRANPFLAPKTLKAARRPWRTAMVGAIAASLLLAVATAVFFATRTETGGFATALGVVKAATLSDGSAMTLNTGSKTQFAYSLLARNVTLKEGEALFDVAKNKFRPFRVEARGMHVRAVGTSFVVKNVAHAPLEVLVRKGVVALEIPAPDGEHRIELPAERRAIIAQNGSIRIEAVSPDEIRNALAWRQGYIFLARRSLGDAAAEFARYNATKILIDDPAIANRMVSGLFKANDPLSFADATARALGLKAIHEKNVIRLSPR